MARRASDVAIIGGGIVGAAAAAFLARAGASVTLYERAEIAAGASGRNSGVVQHPFDPVLVRLHVATVEVYRGLDGFDMPPEPAGLLYVTGDADVARRLAARMRESYPSLDPRFVAGDELRWLEPALAPDLAACALRMGYPVPPATATRAFASIAEASGARIETGAEAKVRREGPKAAGVIVDGRRERAGAVLVTAGPWSPALVDPSGRWRPIRPLWGVVAEVDLPDPPRHVLEEAEIDGSIEPGHGEDPGTVAFSMATAGDTTGVGSTFLPDEPVPADWLPTLIERARRYVPALGDAPLVGSRACARPLSLDGRPLVGPVPGIDGLWICAGHGPWGISTGPATALMVADAILGRETAIPDALDPSRFGRP